MGNNGEEDAFCNPGDASTMRAMSHEASVVAVPRTRMPTAGSEKHLYVMDLVSPRLHTR